MTHRSCAVEGCPEKRSAKGFCRTHHRSWKLYGDPLVLLRPHGNPLVRFLAKVDKDGPLPVRYPELGRCWVWTGNYGSGRYGLFWTGEKMQNAHRWSYESTVGAVPSGMELDHFACDNPQCVNPVHMRPVTHRENLLRSESVSALNLAKTHCVRGHLFDEQNTYWRPDGKGRGCRACIADRNRERAR